MKNKIIVIDIDGTICEEVPTFQKSIAKIKRNAVKNINKLYKDNTIILYTARGWAEYKMTESWLKTNKVNYHLLMCGKPIYDIWIDDKAIQFQDWDKLLKKLK